ncbi:MAG: hypothetical protein M1837_003348 [Sclerophora amabilis]|nr:MAG: hypothetical protein M1837_003348 [Sclerophora amabilis]
MAPSESPDSKAPEDLKMSSTQNAPRIIEENSTATSEAKAKPKGTLEVQNGDKQEKLSGAELKKRAKADKQARRAQEKQAREGSAPGGAVATPQGQIADSQKALAGKGGTPKAGNQQADAERGDQLKRSGPAPSQAQRPLPIRNAKSSATAPSEALPKESNKVALFGHLYGQSRRISIAGAGKEIHPSVLALGVQMGNYVVCGSNARCVATLLVFKKVIESYTTPPGTTLTRHLTSHLSPQIDHLKTCRPLSISMGNAIRWLKLEISTVDIDTPDSESKSHLCSAIDTFIRERITVADTAIATAAASKIQDGDVILTYAKSSIVQQTLLTAHEQGTRFRVIVVDSKPLFEGKHLARALANSGVEVQYSLLHGIGHAIKDASKVFLGAHAMMSNGRLFSRVGTAIVAMMATEVDVPVIVCCESVKFTDRVALDSIVNNEIAPPEELVTHSSWRGEMLNTPSNRNLQLLMVMYDVTPAEYIKMVITEYGSLPPSSVPVVHRLSTNS